MEEITVDAKDRAPGRVASETAILLRGKNNPSFMPHIAPRNVVHIVNASKMKITEAKKEGKVYKRYTGYPGGLKSTTLSKLIETKGAEEMLRKAVRGMLPANKLRNGMLKNLKISK